MGASSASGWSVSTRIGAETAKCVTQMSRTNPSTTGRRHPGAWRHARPAAPLTTGSPAAECMKHHEMT